MRRKCFWNADNWNCWYGWSSHNGHGQIDLIALNYLLSFLLVVQDCLEQLWWPHRYRCIKQRYQWPTKNTNANTTTKCSRMNLYILTSTLAHIHIEQYEQIRTWAVIDRCDLGKQKIETTQFLVYFPICCFNVSLPILWQVWICDSIWHQIELSSGWCWWVWGRSLLGVFVETNELQIYPLWWM